MVTGIRQVSCLSCVCAVLGVAGVIGLGSLPGCSSDDAPAPAPAPATTDSPPGEIPDPGAPSTCAETAAATDAAFDFDPDGPDGQIHAYGVAVSDGVWIVYNRPGTAGAFDVYATKLSCAGVPTIAPVLVSQSDDNEVDPAAAWDETTKQLLVVWSADQAGKTPNLQLRSRVVSGTGEVLGSVQPLDLKRNGAAVGNVWMPQVAKTAAGVGFTLVGTWGHDDAPGFQAFAQALDAQGNLIGEGEDLGFDPTSSHDAPTVAFAADGTRLIAYSSVANDSPSGQGYDVWTVVGAAAPEKRIEEGGHATLAAGASGAWIAAQDVVGLLDAADLTKRKGLYQPAVAVGADGVGAAVLAYTKAANKAPLQAYRLNAAASFVGPGVELSTGAAAYPLHLEALAGAGNVFFVAYQEGAGQTIRGKARFFRLP
jgi:hypothetical protein